MFKEWLLRKIKLLMDKGYLVFDGKKLKVGSGASVKAAKSGKGKVPEVTLQKPVTTKFGLPAKYHKPKKSK